MRDEFFGRTVLLFWSMEGARIPCCRHKCARTNKHMCTHKQTHILAMWESNLTPSYSKLGGIYYRLLDNNFSSMNNTVTYHRHIRK